MDPSSSPILEIGLILLAAVAGGWLARHLGLPAIDDVLFTAIIAAVAVSIAVSSIAVRLVPVPTPRPPAEPAVASG